MSTNAAAIDRRRFREVLAHVPRVVTVLTAHADDGPLGMVVKSLTPVSQDPPLVLFCTPVSSTTWPKLRAAGRLCINVLADHGEALSHQFLAREANRFDGVLYEEWEGGPALAEAVAWIECTIHEERDAGDHTIVVARVTAMEAGASHDDPPPLVYFRGRYGSLRRTTTS
jgi:3-hydroxy-9,10-secoandrosta-1,3,5(10)-triene-9,17-dione monooxygenase reductase component